MGRRVTAAADEIGRWFRSRGRGLPVVMAGTQEARVRAYRGKLDQAAELMEELLPAARESKDVQAYRPALTTAALIAVQRGDPQSAAPLLDELEQDMEGGGYNRAYGMLDGTLVARALADVDRAERIARVEEPFAPGYPLGKALALASQAEVAEAQGRYHEAQPRRSPWTTMEWSTSLGFVHGLLWTILDGSPRTYIPRVTHARLRRSSRPSFPS